MSQRIALVWASEGLKWSPWGECDSNVNVKETHSGASLVVCWLRFHTSTARDVGSIPCWGTKVLHTAQYSQKNFFNSKKRRHTRKKRCRRQKTKVFLLYTDLPGGSDGKASAYNAGDPGSIPGLGRSLGEGNGNPQQYSCLENPMDGGAW